MRTIGVHLNNIRSTWNNYCRRACESWPRLLNASDWRLAIINKPRKPCDWTKQILIDRVQCSIHTLEIFNTGSGLKLSILIEFFNLERNFHSSWNFSMSLEIFILEPISLIIPHQKWPYSHSRLKFSILLEMFNLASNFRSRLTFSILAWIFRSLLENINLAWNFQSEIGRLKISIQKGNPDFFQSLGPLGFEDHPHPQWK